MIRKSKENQVDIYLYGNSKFNIMTTLQELCGIHEPVNFFDDSASIRFDENMKEIIKHIYPEGQYSTSFLYDEIEPNSSITEMVDIKAEIVTKKDIINTDYYSLDISNEQFEDEDMNEEFTHVVANVTEIVKPKED